MLCWLGGYIALRWTENGYHSSLEAFLQVKRSTNRLALKMVRLVLRRKRTCQHSVTKQVGSDRFITQGAQSMSFAIISRTPRYGRLASGCNPVSNPVSDDKHAQDISTTLEFDG